MAKRFKGTNGVTSNNDISHIDDDYNSNHKDDISNDNNNSNSNDYHHKLPISLRGMTMLTSPARYDNGNGNGATSMSTSSIINISPPVRHNKLPTLTIPVQLSSPAPPLSKHGLTINTSKDNNISVGDGDVPVASISSLPHQSPQYNRDDSSTDQATPLSSPSSLSSSPANSEHKYDESDHLINDDVVEPSRKRSAMNVTRTDSAIAIDAPQTSTSTTNQLQHRDARQIVLYNPDLLHCIMVYLNSVSLSYPMSSVSQLSHQVAQQSRLWRHIDLSHAARTLTTHTIHNLLQRYATNMTHLILDGCSISTTTLSLLRSLSPLQLTLLSLRDTSLSGTRTELQAIMDLVRAVPALRWCYSGQSYTVGIAMAFRARPVTNAYGTATSSRESTIMDSVYAELAMELASRSGHCDFSTMATCIRCKLITIVQGCNACGRAMCLSCQHSVAGQSPLHTFGGEYDDNDAPSSHVKPSTSTNTANSMDGLLMTICSCCDRCYCQDCRRFSSCQGGCHSGSRCDQCQHNGTCSFCSMLVCTDRCLMTCQRCQQRSCYQCRSQLPPITKDDAARYLCRLCSDETIGMPVSI
jgi:hypothetical protein